MAGLRLPEGMEAVSITSECLGAQVAGAGGKMAPVPMADLYPQTGFEPYYPVHVASKGVGVADEGMASLVLVRNSDAPAHPVTELGAQHKFAAAIESEIPGSAVASISRPADKGGPSRG